MAEPPFDLASAHRWFGIELNNRIMDALEAVRVTPETGESFIHAAHASCHHWMQVGTVANHGRGEFVVASVYAAAVWAALSDAVEEAVSGTGDPGERGSIDELASGCEDAKEGVGQGALSETRRGVWRGCSRMREEGDGPEDDVEMEGRRGALQAALLRENSQPGRIGTMDCAQTLCAARLESACSGATGATVLPGKQTKRPGFRLTAQS